MQRSVVFLAKLARMKCAKTSPLILPVASPAFAEKGQDRGAIGSFVWDSDANVATSWDITVSAGIFTGNNAIPGETFSSASAGHFTREFTLGGYSFIQFVTDDVSYFPGPDGPRFLRLGLGFSGLDVLDTPVAALSLVPDTANQFPFTITGFVDCGSCSPFRNGKDDSVISGVAPVPLPASLSLMLIGLAALGVARGRAGRVSAV